MAGGLEDFIISEGALHPLHPLDRSPIQIRPGRITNPMLAQRSASQPERVPPPPSVQLKPSKFDQLLGDEEGDFTDKIIDDELPEDWGDDKLEMFDENGWNLLHYSILKGFSNAVQVLVEEQEFDVNAKTKKEGDTPLKLALQKCCDCVENNITVEPFFGIAQMLMKSDKTAAGADKSVLRLAINFPVFLKELLTCHQEFCQCGDNKSSALASVIRSGLLPRYSKMGFIELMLQQNADSIVMDLINNDPDFVKIYVNTSGETPLHTAAKLGNDMIAKQLMESKLGKDMYNKPDRNHFTPIITAVVYCHLHKDSAVKVIKEILSHLCTVSYAKCISAIKPLYRGLPVIEYDIRSGEGVIVQGIMGLNDDACEEILCSNSYQLGNIHVNIFHLAARYGLPLKIFKDGNKFKLEYLKGSHDKHDGDDEYDGDDECDGKDASSTAMPSPCDYAVQYDHIDFLEEAWGYGEENWRHEIKTACKFGNLNAFIFLAGKTKIPLTDADHQNLLCLACKHGQASIVEYFLETVGVSPDRQDANEEKNKPSALMLAADSDAADCVKLLLDHNAKVNDVDHKGYNALCRAILVGKKKAVMAILTHPVHGESALRFCTKRPEKEKTKPNITPMRLLVKHMTDVARWVLNEQIVRDPTTGVIQYKYELIDDFDPENCEFSGPLVYLHHVIKTRQGQDQTDTTIQVTAGNTSYNNLPDSDSNRSSLDDYKPTEYEPYNHMLHLMVKSKSLDLLDHLLVGKVINHYWRYVIWQWIILRSVYLFITVMLTAFTLVLPHPNGEICRGTEEFSDGRRGFLIFSSIILILSALLSLLVSAYTLYVAKLTVFKQTRFRVFFEAILPFLIFLFVIGYGNDEWCSQGWQWNVGAFCTCLSWLSLLVTLKGFRLTAAPINMLFAIIKNFISIIYVPILLIAAFALPFYMLFTVPGQNFGPYQDIGSTLGTVTILFTGEGDYEGQFNSEDSDVHFPFASYFMYFLFVIMVGILFNNLLVSLAVGEVGDLRDNAKLEQYRLNVEGIIDGLEIFFPFIKPTPTIKFLRPQSIEHNESYLNAESEWKKARAENREFADSILQDTSDEIIQSKIDQLEAKLLASTKNLQLQIQELADKINN